MKAFRVAEAAQIQTNAASALQVMASVFWNEKRAIVLACNNQCRPLLSDVVDALPRDSKQEERHVDEGSAFASGQRSLANRLCHNQSRLAIWMRYCHKPGL